MKKTRLDAADIRILATLQRHGSLSKSKLAELVNLSPTPCWARLDRLKKAGLIRGYHATIALETIADLTQVVVTVSLQSHRKSDFARFEAQVEKLSEITECYATGGGMDYVLKVVTPNLERFQHVIDVLLTDEASIARYMTYIVTRVVKSSPPDLTRLLGPGAQIPPSGE